MLEQTFKNIDDILGKESGCSSKLKDERRKCLSPRPYPAKGAEARAE